MSADDELLSALLAEEDELQLESFDNDRAIALGLMLLDEARTRAAPLTIRVTRAEQLLFHAAMPGTVLDNDHWVRRKTATVWRFGHSSWYMANLCRIRGVTLAERYGVEPAAYAASGGAFPVRLRGTGLVGTAAVSGLPQEEDHQLVVAVLRRFAHPT
jgi:uncharacterized protein (UPF0303 family)